jgi:hypothetical protein
VSILLDVYGMSFMFSTCFSRLCWMTCKSFLITLRWRKNLCALMKHKKRQLLEEQKDFSALFSVLFIFQD